MKRKKERIKRKRRRIGEKVIKMKIKGQAKKLYKELQLKLN